MGQYQNVRGIEIRGTVAEEKKKIYETHKATTQGTRPKWIWNWIAHVWEFYCTIVNLFCGGLIDWEIWNWSCPSKTSNDTSIMATYTWNLELWKCIVAFSLTINFVALKSNSDFVIGDNDDENGRDANLDRTCAHNYIEC